MIPIVPVVGSMASGSEGKLTQESLEAVPRPDQNLLIDLIDPISVNGVGFDFRFVNDHCFSPTG